MLESRECSPLRVTVADGFATRPTTTTGPRCAASGWARVGARRASYAGEDARPPPRCLRRVERRRLDDPRAHGARAPAGVAGARHPLRLVRALDDRGLLSEPRDVRLDRLAWAAGARTGGAHVRRRPAPRDHARGARGTFWHCPPRDVLRARGQGATAPGRRPRDPRSGSQPGRARRLP